ncbi:MAG: pentapeptide repeat-containing protein [Acidimicrobiia bacterium]|nr:pentapeptide repeat-containing protein [Acidimicrobiia bacterium]
MLAVQRYCRVLRGALSSDEPRTEPTGEPVFLLVRLRSEPGADCQPERVIEVTKAELKAILADHALWLSSYEAEGSRADLRNANLSNANLSNADLRNAYLRNADLISANLEDANLEGANLAHANLEGASLRNTGLEYANLSSAILRNADLSNADLSNAILREANLREANLREAILRNANLADASLARAALSDANLEGANLEGANLEGAIFDQAGNLHLTRALGRMTRSVSKIKKHPLKAGAFKKLFPNEFEKVKSFSQGKDFTPELLEQLIKKHGFYWSVVPGKYSSSAQRVCSNANKVLMLCVDISDPVYSDTDRRLFGSVKEISVRSGHPVSKKTSLFTVGWVRYCEFPDRILIEEVQSDVGGVRKGLKDEGFVAELAEGGVSAEDLDRSMALMQPFSERFYEDAIGLIFDMAEEQGKNVEMLDYAQKKEFGSPKSVYSDLPKSMGMKLAPSEALPEIGKVWSYTPNRRKKQR